jgi:hypothetical protein
VTRVQAQAVALTAMELAGRTVPEMWAELRRAAGFRPSRKACRATWSDVHDWVTLLVLDAAAEARVRAPRWLLVVVREMRAHG